MNPTSPTPSKPQTYYAKCKTWLYRHTLRNHLNGCLSWNGVNNTKMTDQELAYHWLCHPLDGDVTISMNDGCHEKCVNVEHMTVVYKDVEDRRSGAPQSPETVLRILAHPGDYHDIARLFRASWQTVFNIKNGRSHRDTTGLPFIDVKKKRKPRV